MRPLAFVDTTLTLEYCSRPDASTDTTRRKLNTSIDVQRPLDKMLTEGFRDHCIEKMADGGQNDQTQLKLLTFCDKQEDEKQRLQMVQDLMVYLVIKRGMYIGAVRYEIRERDITFARRLGSFAHKKKAGKAKTREAVAA